MMSNGIIQPIIRSHSCILELHLWPHGCCRIFCKSIVTVVGINSRLRTVSFHGRKKDFNYFDGNALINRRSGISNSMFCGEKLNFQW